MRKEFIKKDLKDWMLVVYRDGEKRIITDNVTNLRDKKGMFRNTLNDYYNDFSDGYSISLDIMEIYSVPSNGYDFSFDLKDRKLLWKRK